MMCRKPNCSFIVFSASLLFCGAGFGQTLTPKDRPRPAAKNPPVAAAQRKAQRSAIVPKITLLDATRVSTADALKAAAEAKTSASAKAGSRSGKAANLKSTPADFGVLEFQTLAPGDATASDTFVAPSKNSKNSFLKNIHGDVYGSTLSAGAGNDTGGAVGATSKGSKTSVYVQTDHSQGVPPR